MSISTETPASYLLTMADENNEIQEPTSPSLFKDLTNEEREQLKQENIETMSGLNNQDGLDEGSFDMDRTDEAKINYDELIKENKRLQKDLETAFLDLDKACQSAKEYKKQVADSLEEIKILKADISTKSSTIAGKDATIVNLQVKLSNKVKSTTSVPSVESSTEKFVKADKDNMTTSTKVSAQTSVSSFKLKEAFRLMNQATNKGMYIGSLMRRVLKGEHGYHEFSVQYEKLKVMMSENSIVSASSKRMSVSPKKSPINKHINVPISQTSAQMATGQLVAYQGVSYTMNDNESFSLDDISKGKHKASNKRRHDEVSGPHDQQIDSEYKEK